MMAMAFTLMRKKMVKYASDDTIEQLAKDYENAMMEANKYAAIAISKAMKGKKHSEETRKKISDGNKGKQAGEKNPNYGKHISEEQKKKMSEAAKGKHWFNNGKINIMAKECPPGFVPGMLK